MWLPPAIGIYKHILDGDSISRLWHAWYFLFLAFLEHKHLSPHWCYLKCVHGANQPNEKAGTANSKARGNECKINRKDFKQSTTLSEESICDPNPHIKMSSLPLISKCNCINAVSKYTGLMKEWYMV